MYETLCGLFLISLKFNAIVAVYGKHLSPLLLRFIVAFLCFIWSRDYIYDPPRLKFVL